tara:strand:+ start:65 stop:484 length:420 start_codon:yes stop_codon:yes gene_type:complete
MYIQRLYIPIQSVLKNNYTSLINNTSNKLDRDNAVGFGLVGYPEYDNIMKLNILVNEKDIITKSVLNTFNCDTQITQEVITDLIQDKHIDDAYLISNKDIEKTNNLQSVKLHNIRLIQDVIQSAIEDYINKNIPNEPVF